MNRLILITFIAALAPAAMAADNTPATAAPATAPAAAPAAPATPVEVIAPTTCEKPTIEYDKDGILTKGKALQVKATAYQSCIDAYVAIQKEAAREHYAAGDAAIRDYNAFVNDVNAANKKLVEKIDKQAKDSN